MKYLVALLVWPITLAAIPARDILFGGQIYVWPFLLMSCLVASFHNRAAAIVFAAGAIGAQVIEIHVHNPAFYQFALYSTIAFTALYFFDTIASVIVALVGLIYLSTYLGIEWRSAVITTEIIIVFGLSASVLDGPSGGIYCKSYRKPTLWGAVDGATILAHQFMGNRTGK